MTITVYPPIAGTTYSSSSAPWYMQVARGLVPGCTEVNIFGYSSGIDGTYFPLWDQAALYVFPTTASVMTLVSTSALDNSGSLLRITGLDASWNILIEDKQLNGTTPVVTTNAFLRINNFVLVEASTGQTTNVGTITAGAGGVTYAQIAPARGRMQNTWYSVPNGYSFYFTQIASWSDNVTGNNFGNFRAITKNNALTNPVTNQILQTSFQNNYSITRVAPLPYTQKTDIQWQFSASSGTHSFSAIIEGILISNTAP